MIEKFRTTLEQIRQNGDIALFAVLKMDDLTDKWSVFFCAPRVTNENRGDIFAEILSSLRFTMTNEELSTIARIVVMATPDHLMDELMQLRTNTHIGGESSVRVNGNMIHDGYILEVNKDLIVPITQTPSA